mmetsp:Transcript_9551/g.13985  ORF Transcript_9551/g.13985 Transcript_9551/m.13985 type:complete len:484 (-) Transcript_9551:149-1600(-)
MNFSCWTTIFSVFFSVFVSEIAFLVEGLSIEEETNGSVLYNEGLRLFMESEYEDAVPFLWKSILLFSHERDKFNVNDAFNQVLMSFERQGSLAKGLAFVAIQLHQRNDQRALGMLKQAYNLDRYHPDVQGVMKVMGETEASIAKGRRYKEEEEEMKDETVANNVQQSGSCYDTESCLRENAEYSIESGWDDNAQSMYGQTKLKLSQTKVVPVYIPPVQPFVVSENKWWDLVNGKVDWEPETFQIFQRYITNETTVIDFGTWIGPTLLFHAQFSKLSIGLEADPVAYATVEHNLQLNQKTIGNSGWASRTILENVAVSTPSDAGSLTMKSTGAGNSEGGVGNRVMGTTSQEWSVNGYSLPYLFGMWGVQLKPDPVFIKIDIESYECRLFPSFYDWFRDEAVLPTIFVSFHPQIEPCTRSQMTKVLEVFQLFARVTCKDDKIVLDITPDTTFDEFEEMLDEADCLSNKDNSDFVLSGRSESCEVN